MKNPFEDWTDEQQTFNKYSDKGFRGIKQAECWCAAARMILCDVPGETIRLFGQFLETKFDMPLDTGSDPICYANDKLRFTPGQFRTLWNEFAANIETIAKSFEVPLDHLGMGL